MSRALEFRAWVDGGFVYLDIKEDNDIDYYRFVSVADENTIEQYIGLKDKNGKKIYEGDIVTLNGEWEEIDKDDCKVITFKDGCFRVGDDYENEAGIYLSDWRIIGTIHENPGLLHSKPLGK